MGWRPASVVSVSQIKSHYAYIIVALSLLTVLGTQGFTRFGYSMLLPGMQNDMHLSFAQAGLLATANYVGFSLASSIIGWAVIRWGFRRIITIGTITVGTAMCLTGATSSYEVALGLQIMAGAATAVCLAPALTLTGRWFSVKRRGMAAGIATGGGPLGSLVTGPLVPLLIVTFGANGWRYSWFALGLAALAIGALDLLLLRDHPKDVAAGPVEAKSTIDDNAPRQGRDDWHGVYRARAVWHVATLALLAALAAISFNTFFATYLLNEHAISTSTVGQLWAITGAAGIVSGVIWGGISDRIGRRYGFIATFSIQALCFALFAVGQDTLIFALCALMYGLTARASATLTVAYCGDLVEGPLAAAALGISSVFAGFGLAAGPTIAGLIADTTSSLTLAFWGSAAIAVIGALGAATLPRKSQRAQLTPASDA